MTAAAGLFVTDGGIGDSRRLDLLSARTKTLKMVFELFARNYYTRSSEILEIRKY